MAPLPYTQRTSSYFSALTQAIDKKLQRALASPTQRRDLLQQLFADVALEVDDRARDIILGREDAASMAEVDIKLPLCFYDVLADHFACEPERGKPILDMIVQLWSQPFASHIFALLFHKWLFEVQLDSSDLLLRYSSALVQGATNVFWIDIQTNTTHFQSLFRYLLEDVALVPERLKKIPFQAQRDLFLLLSRSIFLYNLVAKLESFFQHFPEFPNAFLVGGPADIFVIELTDQLRMTTSTRLKTCLYSFTSPGGPMYPTRAVRHAAWDALDFLFPVSWSIPAAYYQLLFPVAVSMVLAIVLLELYLVMHTGNIVQDLKANVS
ncbi:hypothetical protein Ccrd_009605 [Cynara cardunculus var. scolymus]|uniref:Uncharacterized protein n=1 Tax=Cynara cardunculus var. scolymus TaxID=59895 RepID=A0A103YMX0_CYNCS|nr:hypothetical protein Ccrd_009605 [Cynara cardunculus var. scolymus]